MHNARKAIRRVTLLVVCHTIVSAQSTDLSPLLPPADAGTNAVRAAIESRQIARATQLLPSLDPQVRSLWQGIIAITQNNPTAAIRALRKADYSKALGVAYYLAGQHVLFRDQMAEAIRRDPTDFGPYYYLGRHYDSDVDNAEDAILWLRRALERKADYEPARAHLGNCLERLGRTMEAEAEYRMSPTEPLSQTGLARIRLAAGDLAAALVFVEKAVAVDARDVNALKLAARIYGMLDRPGDAIRALESAAAFAPRDASIQYQLARAYQGTGDTNKSATALRNFERLRAIYGIAK